MTAPIIQEIYQRYDGGASMGIIRDWLNSEGIRTKKGKDFTIGGVSVILKNRKYIGEHKYGDIVIPDAIPAIIDKELFDRVQLQMASNKKAPARAKAEEEYLLTTKLFCGKCGRLMAGESGNNGRGNTYHYYKCSGAKRRLGCDKKAVRKRWMERIVQWISQFKNGNMEDVNYQKQIIDIFLNSIYIFDDKPVFTYNFKGGTETISLTEIESALGSDLVCFAPPSRGYKKDVAQEASDFIGGFAVFAAGILAVKNEGVKRMFLPTDRIRTTVQPNI